VACGRQRRNARERAVVHAAADSCQPNAHLRCCATGARRTGGKTRRRLSTAAFTATSSGINASYPFTIPTPLSFYLPVLRYLHNALVWASTVRAIDMHLFHGTRRATFAVLGRTLCFSLCSSPVYTRHSTIPITKLRAGHACCGSQLCSSPPTTYALPPWTRSATPRFGTFGSRRMVSRFRQLLLPFLLPFATFTLHPLRFHCLFCARTLLPCAHNAPALSPNTRRGRLLSGGLTLFVY